MADLKTKENSPKQKPIELRYTPILDAHVGAPVAYRSTSVVYSKALGTLVEADYFYAADYGNNTGVKLSEWNISEVLRHIKLFLKNDYQVEFLTAKCTSSFAALEDAGKKVESILKKIGCDNPGMLCLEFPQSMLYHSGENARKTVLDLKLLGVKTMVSGCGTSESPMSKFMEIPADFALLDSGTTALIRDRNNPFVLSKLAGYLKSLGLTIIADGGETDDEFRDLSRMDVNYVIASSKYQGNAKWTDGDLSVDEALEQKGAD